jgi:hypothetical protein
MAIEPRVRARVEILVPFFNNDPTQGYKLRKLEVASKACTQAFGTHVLQKRLRDKPLAALS